MLIIPQWRTEQLLRQRLAELGGRVQRGTEATGLVQDAASVTATLVRAGVTERVRAGWLVGCEGGHSVIRKLLGVGFEDQTWEIELMLVGDVEAEGLDRDHWHVWPEAEGGLVGLCPPAGTRSFQFQVKLAAGDSPEPSLQTFQKVLDARTVSACGYMTPSGCRCSAPICGWWTATGSAACCWPMTSRTCIPGGRQEHEHRHPGRLQPGLEAGLGARRAPEWRLGAYEEEWLPVAAWALGISSRRHRELLGDTAAGGAAAPLAEELRQLGIGYVGGALARDIPHPTGRVRAGDRAPDASAATPRAPWYGSTSSAARTARCWPSARVMRTSSCELHGRASRCRGPAGRVGGERDLVDVDGHAHRAYDLDGDALVLVRPDGYIGLLAGPAPRRRSTRVPRPAHRRGGSASLTPGGPPIHDCGWQVSQDCC